MKGKPSAMRTVLELSRRVIWIAKPWERPLQALMNSSSIVVKKKKKKENDAVYVVCPVVLTLSRSPEGSALICLDQCWESIHSFNRLNFWSISCFSQCKISFTRSTPISLFLSPTWLTMTFWSLSQNGVSLRAGPSRVQTAAGPRAPQGAGLQHGRGGPFCWEQELESEPFTDELILWCGAAAAGKTEAWSGRGFTRVLA